MRAVAVVGPAALLALACHAAVPKPSPTPFRPTRFDYARFASDRAGLQEPNYLPFMGHRFALEDGDAIVFCRWDESRFPLAVFVDVPEIDASLQNEFHPVEPERYVEAVQGALRSWVEALPDTVSFRPAARPDSADLHIRLLGAEGPAPAEGVQVLGLTPVASACRALGPPGDDDVMPVVFDVDALEVYVADQHGLLPPDQVERIALHEIGHALGMRGHSPIPADLMFEVARDRHVDRLSAEDLNSFRTLYALPSGTIYARVPRDGEPERPEATAPADPPALAPPYRDARLGFSLRPASGWPLVDSGRGVVVIDGLTWDYEASFQVIVRSYPSIRVYLERYGAGHVGDGEVLEQGDLQVAGRPAFGMRLLQRGGTMTEDHVFVETGDGRVLVVITDSPSALRDGFDPWFRAMLDSVELLPPER